MMFVRRLVNIDQSIVRYFAIVSSSSSVQLNTTMKKFIDAKQYKEALDIYDQHSQPCTDVTFNLVLKACAKLFDRERGIEIHKQLSLKSLENSFIQTSLIHFYSK
jgi:hypothetical protein